MKEVCIDARLISNSGIGTYLKNLLKQLKNAPFAVKLLANPQVKDLWDGLSSFEIIPFSAKVHSLEEIIKLPSKIPSCDVFWSPHYNVPFFPTKAKKRLVTIHDVYDLIPQTTSSYLKKRYAKKMLASAVKNSDRMITVSKFSASEINKYLMVPVEKIEVIYQGVDQKRFSRCDDKKKLSEIRQQYSLPEKFILFVGNISPHKNLQGLIKAFRFMVHEGFKDCHLLVVGRKFNAKDSEALLESDVLLAKQVHLLGNIEDEDLPLIYQMAQVAVLPSFYEGFGLPPLEAMSAGCPVVVSNLASLPEACGDSAEYVDPYDPKDIARGIIKILNDEKYRDGLKNKGLQRVQAFTWEKTAHMHMELIDQLCRC